MRGDDQLRGAAERLNAELEGVVVPAPPVRPRRPSTIGLVAAVLTLVGIGAALVLTIDGDGPPDVAADSTTTTTTTTTADPSSTGATEGQPLEEPKVVLEADGLRLEILSGTGFGKHNIRFWDTREGPPPYEMASLGMYNEPGPGMWLGLNLDADGGVSIHGGAPIDTSQLRVLFDGRVAVVEEFLVREDYGEAFFVARLTDLDGVPVALTDQEGVPLSQERFVDLIQRPVEQGGLEVQALDENGLILETVP